LCISIDYTVMNACRFTKMRREALIWLGVWHQVGMHERLMRSRRLNVLYNTNYITLLLPRLMFLRFHKYIPTYMVADKPTHNTPTHPHAALLTPPTHAPGLTPCRAALPLPPSPPHHTTPPRTSPTKPASALKSMKQYISQQGTALTRHPRRDS
jgi:hypothetical protein